MNSTDPSYLDVSIACGAELREVLAVILMENGYEGTWENDEGVSAYIKQEDYKEDELRSILSDLGIAFGNVKVTPLVNINWNEDWERSYDPILVEDTCYIRAEFHEPKPGIPFEIIIQPKMSFGTGHHDTTYLMVKLMLKMDFAGKKVLDIGCGTGVLAILAKMKGAAYVAAIDNSPWSVDNSIENAERNSVEIQVEEADIVSYSGSGFDILLANINRNINHDNIGAYMDLLQGGKAEGTGILLMSGYFDHDFSYVNEEAIKYGLRLLNKEVSAKGWVAAAYQK